MSRIAPEYGFFFGALLLGFAIFLLSGCTPTETKDAVPAFFTALGAAATAIPGFGPVLGPLIASIGPALGTLSTTHAAAMGAGLLLKHHIDFGATPGRRRKLAGARAAHAAAKAAAAVPKTA